MLLQERHAVDLATRIGIKTASSGLDNPARFIDSPGYYFDASVARSFTAGSVELKPFVMLGFFAWQTNDESLRQNDALLYGIGGELVWKGWTFIESFRGFSGYHEIGDRPQVFQSSIARGLGDHQLALRYQKGVRDYLYNSLELVFRLTLARL